MYNDVFRWCLDDTDGKLDPDKGLWLYGSIGTGKTTLLKIVKAFARRHRAWEFEDGKVDCYSFRISNTIDVCSQFARLGYIGIDTYIDSPRQAFDEIGSETIPTANFGTSENVMQYILQRRYDRRFSSVTHVTTNIGRKQIADIYGARILDRCKEMFNFVEMRGQTFRRE